MSGLVLVVTGAFMLLAGQQGGRMRLVTGIDVHQVLRSRDTLALAYSVRLDSLQVRPVQPDYTLQVWKADTAATANHPGNVRSLVELVEQFPLDTMKIRRVGDSDFRFRLVEYYPDFAFAYRYDAGKDTVPPRAPGITLDVVTAEGTGVATLRTDQPGKDKLDDVLGLGCELGYAWYFSRDSLEQAIQTLDQPVDKVLFSGRDERIYYLMDGRLSQDTLTDGQYYPIPGRPDLGFTVVAAFPDARYLKAVPASRSREPVKPVGRVEVWRKGGGAQEIFLYPNTQGRKGGDFGVPGTGYQLQLGISPGEVLANSTLHIGTGSGDPDDRRALIFSGGRGQIHRGLFWKPVSVSTDYPNSAVLRVRPLSGLWTATAGMALVLLAMALRLAASRQL